MKTALYLLNNFAHDLFTGLWFGSFAGLALVHARTARIQDLPAETLALVAELKWLFFSLGAAALFLVMLSGWIRFLYRREWDRLEDPGRLKKPVLIVKHILLLSCLALGSYYAVLWTF